MESQRSSAGIPLRSRRRSAAVAGRWRERFTRRAGAPQDSTLDNLVHAPGYVTASPGTLGAVLEREQGPMDMVLVSGFGVGASAFEGFMHRNAHRYRMVAVTLPGFEGTAAPSMPASGTSYGDQTRPRTEVATTGPSFSLEPGSA